MGRSYTCLVCNERLARRETSNASPEHATILNNLFSQWYKQIMEIEANGFQYDFSKEVFPFCKICRMYLIRLDKLELKRIERQEKCSRLATNAAKAWMRIPFGGEAKDFEVNQMSECEIKANGRLVDGEEDNPQSDRNWKCGSCSASFHSAESLLEHFLKENKGNGGCLSGAITDAADRIAVNVDEAPRDRDLSLLAKATSGQSTRSMVTKKSIPEIQTGRQLRPRKVIERVKKVKSCRSREREEDENDSSLRDSVNKTESEYTGSSESESETEGDSRPNKYSLLVNLDKKYPFNLLPDAVHKGAEKSLWELDLGMESSLAKSECSRNRSFDVSQDGNDVDEDLLPITEDGSDDEDAIAFRYDNIYPFTLLQTEFGDSGIKKQTDITYITRTKFRYLKKFAVEHVSEGYKCCTCNTVFPSLSPVLAHVRLRHQENIKPSDKIWLRKTSPNRFQYGEFEAEKVNDEFNCKSCSFVTKQKGNMRKHLRKKHLLVAKPECYKPSKEVCEFCGKSFKNRTSLRLHQYIHGNTKDFKCSICEKSFRTPGTLSFHKRTEHNDGRCTKNYTCEFCGRAFNCRPALQGHVTQHTGVKTFDCKDCDKKFSTATALATHRNHHTGKFNYECDICGMKFTQSYSITRHKKVVHKVVPNQAKSKKKPV